MLESIRPDRCNDTVRNDILRADLDWTVLSMEQVRSAAERYAMKVVKRLQCDDFNREPIRDDLNSVISCSSFVPEISRQDLETKDLSRRR